MGRGRHGEKGVAEEGVAFGGAEFDEDGFHDWKASVDDAEQGLERGQEGNHAVYFLSVGVGMDESRDPDTCKGDDADAGNSGLE